MRLTPTDIAIASMPPAAAITLGQVNSIIGIIGGLMGIAYLVWKWRKEAVGRK